MAVNQPSAIALVRLRETPENASEALPACTYYEAVSLLFAKVMTMCHPTSPTLMSWTLMRTVRRGGGCWAAWDPAAGLDCSQGAGSSSSSFKQAVRTTKQPCTMNHCVATTKTSAR